MGIGQFHRNPFGSFAVGSVTRLQQVGKEKQFQYHENDKQFEEYDYPQGLSQRHFSETVVIEIKNFQPKVLAS